MAVEAYSNWVLPVYILPTCYSFCSGPVLAAQLAIGQGIALLFRVPRQLPAAVDINSAALRVAW